MNWTDALPTFDLAGIKPVFDELAGHEVDAARKLKADRTYRRRTKRRTMLDLQRTSACVEAIGRLPEPGESIHAICSGAYSLFHHLPAVLELAAPATIAYLGIATLGFSRENLERLLTMIDAGQVGRLDFLYSVFFRSNEKEICARLTHELAERRQRVLSMRTHAKLLLIETSAGVKFTIESSANLRSCHNVEQTVFTNDAALHDFHRQWMQSIFAEGSTQ